MRSRVMVILKIAREHSAQVTLAEDNDVIQAFTADRTDQSLDIWVLPWRSRGSDNLRDAHCANAITERRGHTLCPGLGHLAGKPALRGIWGDFEVSDPSAIEAEHDQGIKKLERRGDDYKHVNRGNVGQVVAQEAPPGRGGDFGPPGHPSSNCGLADLDAELEQFSVDAGRSPQRVVLAHTADQSSDFCADRGSSRTA